MASSLLTRDRRWAPTRKSGMTVLGKVPKPINLPSQRLENHGLDLNVEIVPKGTLTWGSRSSSGAPNAWGSSALSSPNTDGSAGSSTCVNGRPSSGGSGTRPSTAGSDRSHEPAFTAWGPNSRPSSSSGVVASNQTSVVATRPRSAETRPGSSQLSRFAETVHESTVAWTGTGIAERLGVSSSFKANEFSLSSGDFPTLGSEKNSELPMQRGHSSQGRPASASGIAATQKDAEPSPSGDGNVDSYPDHGKVNTWKTENYPQVGGGAPPNMENWQKDPQQAPPYPSLNMPPHQFDPWHGPPIHSPDGVWYRGGQAGGPYRPAVPPGSYPIEQYAYYLPQIPARPVPSSQSAPRPGAGPGGYHPKNGESFRPHVPPDSYMVPSHPVIPVRPGVYPGPVPYDGYYGPHRANFCNSNEQVPVMGMAVRPGLYNQHPNQNVNHEPGKFHARPGAHTSVMAKEQMESDYAHEAQEGQYKVLLKQHDGWEDNDAQEKREQPVMASTPHFERGNRAGAIMREGDRRTKSRKDERTVLLKSARGEGTSSQPASDWEDHSSDPATNSPENSSKAADGSLIRKPETATVPVGDLERHPTVKKNATLIEKIEGLNSKARIADGRSEVGPFSSREEKTIHSKVVNTKADHSTKVIRTSAASIENARTAGMVTPVSNELDASIEDISMESCDGKVVSRPSESQVLAVNKSDSLEFCEKTYSQGYKRVHSVQGRPDSHAKLRLNRKDDDERMKKSSGRDSPETGTVTNSENYPGVCEHDSQLFQEDSGKQELHHTTKDGAGSHVTSSLDSVDHKAQRAKLKEIAIQRAKEEEERIREQKAKALAKLEELNRRTSAESSIQKSDHAMQPSNNLQQKQESGAGIAPKVDTMIIEAPDISSASNSDELMLEHDSAINNLGESTNMSLNVASQASKSDTQESAIPHGPSSSLGQDTIYTEVTTQKTSPHFQESSVFKQKQMGYRRKQNIQQEKSLGEKVITAGSTGSPKNLGDVTVDALSSDSLPNNEDPSVQHKKKNNRSARIKSKMDEASSSSTLPFSVHQENLEKVPIESANTKSSVSLADAISVPAQNLNETGGDGGSRDIVVTSTNQGWSQAADEAHGRVSNQWKSQPHRRSTRNQQANRLVDKLHGTEAVIWAPVRPLNKKEPSEEGSQNNTTEANKHSSGKNGQDVQNSLKTKRAEMERYVPKPVAKELLQQGNSQQPSSSLNQAASDDMTLKPDVASQSIESGLDGLTVGKVEFVADTKGREDNKPNRHGRTHASWRQRSSAESPSALQSSHEGSFPCEPTITVQKPSDEQQPSKLGSSPKGQLKCSDDDWNSNNDSLAVSEPVTLPAVVKDHGVSSRQRRLPSKVHKITGSSYVPVDNKNLHIGPVDKSVSQFRGFDLNDSDGRNASRTENQNAGGEHTRPQWQPKSQTYSHNHRQGSRGSGAPRFPSQSQSGRFDKEFPLQDTVNYSMENVDSNALTQRTDSAEIRNVRHQEAKGEKKDAVDPSKEQTPSLDHDFPTAEHTPAIADAQHEQPISSGLRRHGQHNNRFNRGQEATYGGRGPSQDSGKQNLHVNRDRRKQNSHLEYQRSGSFNNKHGDSSQQNSFVGEEAQEGPHAPGSRYRERAPNHSRRGGQFYTRNSGTAVRVGDSYNSGE